MNRQVNPDHCYETDDGVMYMLQPAYGTPEWHVMKDGREYRTFTSLYAAKCWLEHVLEYPQSDRSGFVQRLAKDVLQQLDQQPICPRCSKPFKAWRHSRIDGAPVCEPCFAEENQ